MQGSTHAQFKPRESHLSLGAVGMITSSSSGSKKEIVYETLEGFFPEKSLGTLDDNHFLGRVGYPGLDLYYHRHVRPKLLILERSKSWEQSFTGLNFGDKAHLTNLALSTEGCMTILQKSKKEWFCCMLCSVTFIKPILMEHGGDKSPEHKPRPLDKGHWSATYRLHDFVPVIAFLEDSGIWYMKKELKKTTSLNSRVDKIE